MSREWSEWQHGTFDVDLERSRPAEHGGMEYDYMTAAYANALESRAQSMLSLITQIAEGRAGNPVNAAQRFLEGLEAGS